MAEQITPIDSASDPRISPYVSIRERDLTRGHGARFIVEGRVTLDTLVQRSRFEIESVFLSESRLEPLADILSALPADVPVYVAAQETMDQVAGFPVHRGVLACGKKGEPHRPENVFRPAPSTLLLLSGLSNHDNVGAAFRNAAAFGADGVLLDSQTCDPLYRKAIRVSAGASLWLPFAEAGSGADMLKAAQSAGYTIWAMTPRPDATPLQDAPLPDRLAILLGEEGYGLPDSLIEAATPIRLPMSPGFDSINVATAGAIALSHVFNARQIS